jgi:hypothetical protein
MGVVASVQDVPPENAVNGWQGASLGWIFILPPSKLVEKGFFPDMLIWPLALDFRADSVKLPHRHISH